MLCRKLTLMWLVLACIAVLPTVSMRRFHYNQQTGLSDNKASAPDRIVSESTEPGAIQKVRIVPDGYCGSPRTPGKIVQKLCGCKKNELWQLKKRNGHKKGTTPKITIADFTAEVVKDDDMNWIFKGPLNGFDSYANLAIASIQCKQRRNTIRTLWPTVDVEKDPREAVLAEALEKAECRLVVTFLPHGVHSEDANASQKIHAEVVANDYCESSKDILVGFRHYCTNAACSVKPMRPTFTAELSEVEKALSRSLQTNSSQDGTLTYSGAPNGWEAFQNLPAVVMCGKDVYTKPDATVTDSLWASPDDCRPSEVQLQEPDWTKKGWAEGSLGFVFWYTPASLEGPSMYFGETDLLEHAVEGRTAKRVHAFAHRYKQDKSFNLVSRIKDFYTYHAAVLVQWSETIELIEKVSYSVIELAWLDGLGGYRGKSNWYEDKEAKEGTELYRTMQSNAKGMIRPWQSSRSELRVLDVDVSSPENFEEFLAKYSKDGKSQRFYDVHGLLKTGADVTPAISQKQLFEGLLRYQENTDGVYSEDANNCQTLQADLYQWLTGIDLGIFEKRLPGGKHIMTHKNRVACFTGPCDGR